MRASFLLVFVAACGSGGGGTPDMTTADMTLLVNGCPPLTTPQAQPGDPIGGDTWATFAQGFFASWCTRCHSSTLSGNARNGAPDGYNWDDMSAVIAHAGMIRAAVGVGNFMPPSPPTPPCEMRQRIVRWIDAGKP